MMKKTYIILLIFLFICACLVISYFIIFPNKEQKLTLYKDSGTVLFKKHPTAEFQELKIKSIELESPVEIKTQDAYAFIIFDDNSMITLDENTEIEIKFNDDQTNVFQIIGNTWHRIKKLTESKTYQVETPTTLATVRGTKFTVENSNDTRIHVLENSIQCKSKDLNDLSIIVSEGFECSFANSKESEPIAENSVSTQWFYYNWQIDQAYDNYDHEKSNIKDFLAKIFEIKPSNPSEQEVNEMLKQLAILRDDNQDDPSQEILNSILEKYEQRTIDENSCKLLEELTKDIALLESHQQDDSQAYQELKNYYNELDTYCQNLSNPQRTIVSKTPKKIYTAPIPTSTPKPIQNPVSSPL